MSFEEGWVVVESYPKEDMEKEHVSAAFIAKKWFEVADDMALIPERNVRVREAGEQMIVEVSEEMYDCVRGM